MTLNHILQVFWATWKHYIFDIWKPIEKIQLFNPPFFSNFSPKYV